MNQMDDQQLVRVDPPSLFDGTPFSMSQATLDPASGLAFVSGQVAWDASAEVRGADHGEQARAALANLRVVLRELDATPSDIVHLRILARGELADHMAQVMPPIVEFLAGARPSMTGIGVASLATRDTLIEIEAVVRPPRR